MLRIAIGEEFPIHSEMPGQEHFRIEWANPGYLYLAYIKNPDQGIVDVLRFGRIDYGCKVIRHIPFIIVKLFGPKDVPFLSSDCPFSVIQYSGRQQELWFAERSNMFSVIGICADTNVVLCLRAIGVEEAFIDLIRHGTRRSLDVYDSHAEFGVVVRKIQRRFTTEQLIRQSRMYRQPSKFEDLN